MLAMSQDFIAILWLQSSKSYSTLDVCVWINLCCTPSIQNKCHSHYSTSETSLTLTKYTQEDINIMVYS
jgi:hypothetical protein